MNLREAYASTHHANLGWDADYERAIDRVASGGFCNALGLALWKAKYMGEAWGLRDSLKYLKNSYGGRYGSDSRAVRWMIAQQVLHEFLDDKCHTCRGVGEMVIRKVRVVCKVCRGVRVRWYGDDRRAEMMGISLAHVRVLTPKIAWLADVLERADRLTNAMMVFQLERGLTLPEPETIKRLPGTLVADSARDVT